MMLAKETEMCFLLHQVNMLTSSIAPSTPHGFHQSSTATRPGPKKPSPGAPHHGSVVRPWPLASHPPPGHLVVGSDLVTTALKNLYIPAI